MPKPAPNPLIYTYLKKFQEDPESRVFAPLAEAYRKAGLFEEAVAIAREGLKVHPNFVGGKVALARALFDRKLYAEVIEVLLPVTHDVPDNLVAQRLVGESALMLGRIADALGAYKMLLYFAPQDFETAQIVEELEAQAYEKGALVLRTDPVAQSLAQSMGRLADEFSEAAAADAIDGDPGVRRAKWIGQIEKLQTLLQQVERYRQR